MHAITYYLYILIYSNNKICTCGKLVTEWFCGNQNLPNYISFTSSPKWQDIVQIERRAGPNTNYSEWQAIFWISLHCCGKTKLQAVFAILWELENSHCMRNMGVTIYGESCEWKGRRAVNNGWCLFRTTRVKLVKFATRVTWHVNPSMFSYFWV